MLTALFCSWLCHSFIEFTTSIINKKRLNIYICLSKVGSLDIHISKYIEKQSWIIHAINSSICTECTEFSVYNLVSITRTMKGATCMYVAVGLRVFEFSLRCNLVGFINFN